MCYLFLITFRLSQADFSLQNYGLARNATIRLSPYSVPKNLWGRLNENNLKLLQQFYFCIFLFTNRNGNIPKKISLKIRKNLQGDAMIKVQTAPFPYG